MKNQLSFVTIYTPKISNITENSQEIKNKNEKNHSKNQILKKKYNMLIFKLKFLFFLLRRQKLKIHLCMKIKQNQETSRVDNSSGCIHCVQPHALPTLESVKDNIDTCQAEPLGGHVT